VANSGTPTGLLDRRFGRPDEQPDDPQDATPDGRLAVVVIGLAVALTCMPAAVVVLGVLRESIQLSVGLQLAGTFVIGLKVLSIVYGIAHQSGSDPD
jgi:hypothetical protein